MVRGASDGLFKAVTTAANTRPVASVLRLTYGWAQALAQTEFGPPSAVSTGCHAVSSSPSLWTAKEKVPFAWLLHITPSLSLWNVTTADRSSLASPAANARGVPQFRSLVVLWLIITW